MAMSDTNSSHTDWVQIYHRSSFAGHPVSSSAAESTVVTTTSPPSSVISGMTPASSSNIMNPSAERRTGTGRPARRRSRASRKAPTTLLNTDTSNFRAMVQQFTGIPSGPSTFGSVYRPATMSFGGHGQLQQPAVVAPFSVQQPELFRHQQYQHHQQQQQQQQHEGLMFTLGNNNSESSFLQGFNTNNTNNSSQRANMEISGGFLMEGISPQVMSRPSATDNRTNNDGFIL